MTALPWRAAACAFACALVPALAAAQPAPETEAITIGGWAFRPLLEVRVRGEYRRNPLDTGGDVYRSTAVLADAFDENTPEVVFVTPRVQNQWSLAERARLGLAADRGPVTAMVTLQDSRLWGTPASATARDQSGLPSFGPWEAYVDVHSRKGRRMFLRLGRQRVTWGDGRLIGESDWSPTPRSLDAARFGVQIGDVDVQAMAALLEPPGSAQPPGAAGGAAGAAAPAPLEGSGAQLYGADATWRFMPLLNLEGTALARIVREPRPDTLAPSDTFVLDARLFGDHRGLRYAVEGAYELGRVASYGMNRDLSAFALAARVELETALLWHLTFGVHGAYATGETGPGAPTDTLERFDPILPEVHSAHAPMDLFAWSNVMSLAGTVSAEPLEDLDLRASYQITWLAEPGGRWTSAALLPIGAAPDNTSRLLGHQLSLVASLQPWEPVRFDTGYGLFLLGDGARAIVTEASRCELSNAACEAPKASHWAFLQAVVRIP